MVLTLLPTAVFAAGELPDVKLSVPTTFDKTVDLTEQNKELKIKDSKTYLIKGSADPNWYFQYRIKIDGKGKNITPHIFLDGVRLQAPEDGPAIELYGGAWFMPCPCEKFLIPTFEPPMPAPYLPPSHVSFVPVCTRTRR